MAILAAFGVAVLILVRVPVLDRFQAGIIDERAIHHERASINCELVAIIYINNISYSGSGLMESCKGDLAGRLYREPLVWQSLPEVGRPLGASRR